MTVAASPRARILRSTLSESGPRLTRSPTNQSESRSAENFRALSRAPSSASQPCTSPIAYSAIRHRWSRQPGAPSATLRASRASMAREQARRYLPFIANGNGAGEYKALVARIGLLLDIGGLDFDADSGIDRF